MEKLQEAIAVEIQSSRRDHGLQQKDLAKAIGVTRTSVSNMERGKQGVSLSMFCAIADALNEDPGDFLNRILSRRPISSASSDDVEDAHIRELINKTIK